MNYEVYSIESYENFFCYTGYDYTHSCWYQFAIGCGKNDSEMFHKHLFSNMMQIGFNNLCVFYPVLHYFIQNFTYFKNSNPDVIAASLHLYLEEVMEMDNYFIKDSEKYVKQIDLFRILHYNNKNRATSLADIKFNLGMEIVPKPNIKRLMPGDIYDVMLHSTNNTCAIVKLFNELVGRGSRAYYKNQNIIQLRFSIKNSLHVSCINYSDSKLGEQIVLRTYCKEKEIDYSEIKDKRTNYVPCRIGELIPKLKFSHKEFSDINNYYESFIYTTKENGPDIKINFLNTVLSFGSGGIHSVNKQGVYKSDDTYTYLDIDASSYYPSIMSKYKIHPAHLDDDFVDIFKSKILDRRFIEMGKDVPDKTIINTLKNAGNSCIGKMNDSDSPLYDPRAFLSVVFTAQILTMYLIDNVSSMFSIEFVFVNTDGMVIKIKNEDLNDIKKFINGFAVGFDLHFKINQIKNLFMKDVNNYTAEYADGTYKSKGVFEIQEEFHKDSSSSIIPMALFEYFHHNIPIETTIKNCNSIYPFFIRLKIRNNMEIYYKNERLYKTHRYYMSTNNGDVIEKVVNMEKQPLIRRRNQTLADKVNITVDNANIDYSYYISECRKIIDSVTVKQLELF